MWKELMPALAVTLVLTGCSWGKSEPEPPVQQPEKLTLQIEVNGTGTTASATAPQEKSQPLPQAAPAPAAAQKVKPVAVPGKDKPKEKAAKKRKKAFWEADDEPVGLEAELNDKERAIIQEVKEKNQRSQEANERKVFFGM